MRFELTPAQRAWRDEVRAFIAAHMTPALEAELATAETEGRDPLARAFIRALGAKGWWGIAWPTELGGLGRRPAISTSSSRSWSTPSRRRCT